MSTTAESSCPNEAIGVFHEIQARGMRPNTVTIMNRLPVCALLASLNLDGLQLFDSIRTIHGMKPTIERYASAVGLLSRGGRLDDVFSFVTQMLVEPNANIWGTLVRVCTTYNRMDLGLAVVNHLLQAGSNDIGDHVLILNMYAKYGKWEGVMEMRNLVKKKEIEKPAGCSWLEVDGQRNVFVSGDCSHHQRDCIFDLLYSLSLLMKELVAF